MSDQQLLCEYLNEGSQRAFQTLVQRHVDLVYSTALRRLSDIGAAEEVTQNVFVALAQKAPFLNRGTNLAGWLYKTTLLEARHRLRAELRRKRREQAAIALGANFTMKQDDSLLKSLSPVLDEALMDLREKDRHAVLLRFIENKDLREVGQALGVGEDAAQKRVAKALEELAHWFRRHGYTVPSAAAVGVALHGAVQAAPAGLAFVAAQTALQTPSAAALVGLTSLIAKFMALTKIQTSVACLIVAAAPVVYEWHKLADANSTQRRLNTELTQLRQGINAGERATNTLERKLRHRERLVADWRQASETPIANRATIPSAAGAASAYVWDEQSGYVRLPKGLALRLRFSEFEMQPRRKASPERVQRPTIDKDGTPSTVLLHALGLTGEEGENVSQTTRNAFREFAALAASHSYVVNEGHSMRENADRYTWVTPALLIEGEQFQENFFNSLVQVMGEERTRIFWQQAQDVFRDVLNEFGQSTKTVSVTSPSENGDVGIIENYYRSDGTVRASRLYDAEWDYLPDALKPYAANLKKPANPQPGEQK